MKELLTALHAVRTEITKVPKGSKNEHFRYRYANLEDYISTIMPPMIEHGLVMTTTVLEVVEMEPGQTNKGDIQYRFMVKVQATLYHTGSGQSLTVDAYGEGRDGEDKAVYKAITGARKYLIACLFGIYTTDDPEVDGGTGGPAIKKDTPPPTKAAGQSNRPKATAPALQGDAKLISGAKQLYGQAADADELLAVLDRVAAGQNKFETREAFVEAIQVAESYTTPLTLEEGDRVQRKISFILAASVPGTMTAAELERCEAV